MRQQYKITLGDDLRARLDSASKQSGRPVSDEIRARLEQSLDDDLFDEQSRELAASILETAREVEAETGASWHRAGATHRTFRRAMLRILSKWRPADYVDNILEQVELSPFQERQHATQPINDADQVGIALADMVLNVPERTARANMRVTMEKTLKDMVKLQQSRGEEGND
jgi:predicted DNA-binding protein